MLKKILHILRKVFHLHSNANEDINPDDFHHCKHSAEGWELVDDLRDTTPPAGEKDTGNKTSRIKSSLPPYPVVWTYFTVNGYPEPEALQFYRCYQVIGWNTRIITSLTNWQQLADHWMQQARQPRKNDKPKSPPNDNHPGTDQHDT